MEYHLVAMSAEIWESIKGYITPHNGPTIKAYESNAKAIVAIVTFLNDAVFSKVTGAKSAKEIWDKLKSVFEGDEKTKQAKITNLKHKFSTLR